MDVIKQVVLWFNYFVGGYYGLINLIYTLLLLAAFFAILRHLRRLKYSPFREFGASPETPPVTVLIPAFNEQDVIVRTVKSALSMRYPYFDVVVINDGSKDSTLDVLIDTFDLKRVDMVYRDVLKTMPVKGFYYNKEFPYLLVVDKEKGGKADALNCGINMCKSPYFCTADADSILEQDALIKLITNILDSPVPVIACGGVVRALNGCEVIKSSVVKVDLPKSKLAVIQIVEYLRAFLFGRTGLNTINSILILSGAFSLYDKAAVIEVGGYDVKNVSEDMELVVKLHRHFKKKKQKYVIKFISDPICWTEVPETFTMLGRQRRRWHLGLVQSLLKHRAMILNPSYGRLGMFVVPYYVFIEMLSPVVEVFGYTIVIVSYATGLLSTEFFLLFLSLAIVYGIFLSTAGVFLEELTYRRYPKLKHFARLLLFGVLENIGYRQLNSFWRLQAFFKLYRGQKEWEYVERHFCPECGVRTDHAVMRNRSVCLACAPKR